MELYFDNVQVNERTVTKEKGYGRIETREYFLETETDWLSQKSKWTNLNAIGMVKSTVIEKGETRSNTRFFITSLTDISEFAYAVRKHCCLLKTSCIGVWIWMLSSVKTRRA